MLDLFGWAFYVIYLIALWRFLDYVFARFAHPVIDTPNVRMDGSGIHIKGARGNALRNSPNFGGSQYTYTSGTNPWSGSVQSINRGVMNYSCNGVTIDQRGNNAYISIPGAGTITSETLKALTDAGIIGEDGELNVQVLGELSRVQAEA